MKCSFDRGKSAKSPFGLLPLPLLGAVAALLLVPTVSVRAQGRGPSNSCDRECLRGFVTQYLDAMGKHNPAALTTAPGVRFTEDTKEIKLGEGLWKNFTKAREFREDFLDVRDGMAASFVVVEENAMPIMLALRLKVVDKKITEVETIIARSRGGTLSENLIKPRAAMLFVPDAAQRNSRADLIRIAEYYPAGLKVGGSFAAVDAPFAPDAYRIENGGLMAGPGARAGGENIKTQSIIAHPDVTYRLVCVDEDLGIVVFRQDFGNTGSYGAGNALTMFEAFKIYGGQIHAVEAFMVVMPENTPSGWPAYEVKKPK